MGTRVISFVSWKGGVGKSTLALLLGYCYGRSGRRVLLLDTDSGMSIVDWEMMRKALKRDIPFTIAEPQQFNVKQRKLKGDDREWDLVLIDCPARFDRVIKLTIKISDAIVTPLILASFEAYRLYRMASDQTFFQCPKLIVVNLVNRWRFERGQSELEMVQNLCGMMQCEYVMLGDRKEFAEIAQGIMPWDRRSAFRLFSGTFFSELDELIQKFDPLLN